MNTSVRVSPRIAILLGLFAVNLILIAGFGVMTQLAADGPNVIDLQLSISPGVFRQITGLWGPGGVAAVRRSIIVLDFLFPIAYAAFISRLYVSLCETVDALPRRRVAALPWIAAAADYIENVLLLMLLGQDAPSLWLVRVMSGAAIIKLALLSLAAGFVVAALFKGDRGRVIRGARYSVLSLLIGTLPLIALDQGRDLLLGLADPSAGRHQFAFIIWTLVWAVSVWYWSRVVLEADASTHRSALYAEWATWLPRLAGFLTLFVPALACYLAARTAEASHDRLVRLAWACALLSVLFLIYVIVRRRIPMVGGPTATSYDMTGLPAWSRIIFALSAAFSVVMFAWLTYYSHDAGHRFGVVAILSIVGANTVFLGSIAVFLTRARGVPVEVVAFACAAVFSLWNDNHVVRLIDLPASPPRPQLSEVFSSWVTHAPAVGGAPVPVIVAAAEGGGIRAAYWTSAVLHHLADIPDADVMFPNRLFAISSVSGGSFGAAVYAGLRRDPTSTPPRPQIASEILRERFLAPMVAKLVAGDLAQWFWPFPIRRWDRSSAMEVAFANAYDEHVHHNSMAERVTGFRPLYSQDVPVLLLNSTSVEMGRRVVTTPYRWPLSDISVEEQEPIDFHQLTGRDVTMATAVHNTARFPYISSAGRLVARNGENLGHIVDGGYFENTGADTLIDLLRYLKQAASPLNVRFIVVALLNTPSEAHLTQPDRIPWRKAESLGEVFAPVRGLLRTRLARGDLALRRLREQVEPGDMIEFRICSDAGLREAPLGWQLSKEMVDVLDANLTQGCFRAQVEKLKAAIRR